MIDEFIRLIERLAQGKANNSEREELKSKLFQLFGQERSAVNNIVNRPAITGLDADKLDGYHGEYYRDADKLDGQHGSYYQDASNINAGTLSTDRFSAYNDLIAEGKIGTESGKVAPGDHTHSGMSSGGDVYFWIDGALSEQEDVVFCVAPRDAVIAGVYVYCQDTGTNGTTIVDLHKNGTTIFTTQSNRPSIPYDDADGMASAVPDVTGINAGDILSLDIDQVATGAERLAVVIAMNYVSVVPPTMQLYFAKEGDITQTETGRLKIYNRSGRRRTISGVYLTVDMPPSGDDLIVDVNINGVSIFNSSDRPRITLGNTSGQSTNLLDYYWEEGEYITVDIDQVGSFGGSNLVITIVYT